ncbi:hypothetical protein CBR_g39375 [Chara braunii]|uniref:Reverse transcriptase domain-containing protein n=1 Tax=Chara braunii TaxID=69332 RepID=A0A388LRG6_CHABU|nr:hypothetical protein CBR_g39375 [Chara braunii]|eukprot:GBG84914.1 hypothetical protein CBR_g39375 [Chara braunii]
MWDQLYELHVPQYVPDEIHHLVTDILKEYKGAISVTDTDIGRIREFEANGWIEPGTGPWSFPVVLVPKKNGSIRICIDYHKLNDITIKDVYPLPRIDDLLDAIGCANYFSKFDIHHGFHHILVKEENRPQTAFVLFEGTWQWFRCLVGICNAPATFQQAMNVTFQNFVNKTQLIEGMINFCVIVYMNDILVYSETYHGHAQHIEWTLGALRDAGFKVALEKNEFFLSEISFLGYVVTRGGLRPDSRKVAVVKDALIPTSLTQICSNSRISTTGVYEVTEFRFTGHRQAIVLAEASVVRRQSAPGVSHVSTVVIFNGDISMINPLRHTAIRTSLREWGQQLATEWNQWLTRRGDNLIPRTASTSEGSECLGTSRRCHRQLIVWELTIPLPQPVDDLSFDIISQCDESPVSYVLSRTLTPYLLWLACLEEQGGNNNPPSQAEYLNPRRIIHISFFQPHTTSEDEVLALEEEEEENEENDEEEEKETPEEGSYNEHSEEEQSGEEEEEEDKEQEESEWENLGEEASHTEIQEEDPEETARRRGEIAAGKQPLEYASGTDMPTSDDPTKDPKPPKPEDGDLAAETSSAPARRRRSRSPSPSTSARPPVRARTDAGHRASSPVLIPLSP